MSTASPKHSRSMLQMSLIGVTLPCDWALHLPHTSIFALTIARQLQVCTTRRTGMPWTPFWTRPPSQACASSCPSPTSHPSPPSLPPSMQAQQVMQSGQISYPGMNQMNGGVELPWGEKEVSLARKGWGSPSNGGEKGLCIVVQHSCKILTCFSFGAAGSSPTASSR